MDAADPVAVAFDVIVEANGVPAIIFPTVSEAYRGSLSWKGFISKFESEFKYFTYIVGYSIPKPLFGVCTFWIVAVIPDICPVIFLPTKFSKYEVISTPYCWEFNLTALNWSSKVIFPGITNDPS